jgi:hypothetical protein
MRRAALLTLLLLLIPATASAVCKPNARRARCQELVALAGGSLQVHNPNAARVEVLVDGVKLGFIDPGRSRTFDDLAPGKHRLRVRYRGGDDRFPLLVQRIRIPAKKTKRVALQTSHLARVRVASHWVEPLSVEVDGWSSTTLYPDRQAQVRARRGSLVVLRTATGAEAARWRVRADRLALQAFELVPPPTATLAVHNPADRPLMLVDARTGHRLGRVPPGRSRLFTLPSGVGHLLVQRRGAIVDDALVVASPWELNEWVVQLPEVLDVVDGRVADGRSGRGHADPRPVRVADRR